MITIQGANFGSEFTDNPVQISTLGGVGSIDCFLQLIRETQITCRLDKTNKEDGTNKKRNQLKKERTTRVKKFKRKKLREDQVLEKTIFQFLDILNLAKFEIWG